MQAGERLMTVTTGAPSKVRLAEVAREAADILQRHGKCVGTLQSDDGRVCMWGALQLAAMGRIDYGEPASSHEHPELSALRSEIAGALPAEADNSFWPGQGFNDESSKETVQSFLHDLADRLDPQD